MSGRALALAAESYVGASFRLHGRDPITGFDCLGLVLVALAEIGRPVRVIATGGLAVLFDKHTDAFDAIEPDLTIQGLALLAAASGR